jgi:hypothetical protein
MAKTERSGTAWARQFATRRASSAETQGSTSVHWHSSQRSSVLAFGLGILPDVSHRVVGGVSDDADVFLWMLRWWPYAIGHGQDPLLSHAIFAPTGVNLAWATSVPLPSLLAAPLTLSFGMVPSFDVLSLVAPALAAFGGYVLCRQIVAAFWPAVAGGLLFGFSAYES